MEYAFSHRTVRRFPNCGRLSAKTRSRSVTHPRWSTSRQRSSGGRSTLWFQGSQELWWRGWGRPDGNRQGRRSEDTNAGSLAYNKDGISIRQVGVADLTNFVPQASVDVVICATAPQDDPGIGRWPSRLFWRPKPSERKAYSFWQQTLGRLQQQLARATQRRLEWICQVHLVFESPISNTGEPHYIEQRTVPLLLFGKPGARLDGGDDVMVVPPQPEESKNKPQSIRHAADLVIGRFVKPGQVVCVPELSRGSSSLLMAAARAGCKIIAADDKPSRIRKVAKELSKLRTSSFSNDRAGA